LGYTLVGRARVLAAVKYAGLVAIECHRLAVCFNVFARGLEITERRFGRC
jgi:hypothetical protein